ncbi:MAG: alpha-L-fucosidase [Proteobacteria bacterium]|nr:alpha-L-fucosidase [Pseudomonadota bacterium]
MPEADLKTTYPESLRRLLIDMHIPDWDTGFLERFDPELMARDAINTGADGIMIYFQSHVGLCNWPTESGEQHRAFTGGDPMRVLIDTLKDHGVGICAYYSTMFNTWAYNRHPEWRIKPAAPAIMGPLPMARYGLCCPNNPDYRQFVRAQATEIVLNYTIDTFFYDMMWWPAVCLCDHCQARCLEETGAAIPATVDWNDPQWCAFQQAREKWITGFAVELKELVHQLRPGTTVYHNFALAMSNWSKGVSFASTAGHDFLGGDFYGGRNEQLVISKLMLNLSTSRPTEFMTTVARNLVDHEQLQNQASLETQVFGATGASSAFLMIAAVDPDGRNNPAMLNRIKAVFEKTRPYEAFIGGNPIEDIGVYFSDHSKMNFADNGTALAQMNCGARPDYPHFEAVKGACTKLAATHLPFGVITGQRLDRLSEYKLIVLPNLLRMTIEEVHAFRDYVKQGGKLYASRLTSLTLTDGTQGGDFSLAEVFGCHFNGETTGRISYSRPACKIVSTTLRPERQLGHRNSANEMTGAVRLQTGSGEALAKLSLPFGYPHDGTTSDQNWASIHSDPPWTQLEEPSIVSNRYGKGRAIFSAADIEAGDSEGCSKLFVGLIKELLGEAPAFTANTHPAVWMNAFDQPQQNRCTISFLNYQLETPVLPIANIPFELKPPEGKQFTRLLRLPEMTEQPMQLNEDGRLIAELPELKAFAMYAAEYQ